MDERLEKALDFSNYRISIENRRKAIKRRFDTMQTVYYNNGSFIANDTTISFISILLSDGQENTILLDQKDNPIKIDNLKEFKDLLLNTYYEAVNEYSSEMEKLKKARDIKKAMNW